MADSSQNSSKYFTFDDARTVGDTRLRFLPFIPDGVRLIILAVIVGIITGAFAGLLKWMIKKVTSLLGLLSVDSVPDWTMLWLPVLGIVFTGIYQRYILHDRISHGVDRLVNDLAAKKYYLSSKLTVAPLLASTLTLGFGGSAGSEGPIAYSGAAIGSNVARICGLRSEAVYLLIACGAGAGIAGIFKAPVGGVLFTLEVLGIAMTTVSVIALFAASIASALTAYTLSGFTLDIPWNHNVVFDTSMIVPALILGVFCGLYSLYYSAIMDRMRHFYESIRNPWIMNIVSGAVLAVTIFIFPVLYGEGYDVIGKVINMTVENPFTKSLLFGVVPGKIALIVVLGGVMLAKCFACSASNCGGGVAGDFAPTLFAGCIAGLFFALVVNPFFDFDMKPQVFAYLGMAGVMAGVIRAPLMALFITAEMCNGFDYFLPLTIVSVISYAIVMVITKRKFYEVHFHFHIHHNH